MRSLLLLAAAAAAAAKTVKVSTTTRDTRACIPGTPFAKLPFCDTTLSIDERVADLIERLWQNTSWIAPQLTARHSHGGGGNPGNPDAVPELGLPEYDWGLNCIHGVQSSCVQDTDGTVYCPTSFPNPVNFGAAWNDSLSYDMGAIIATETRALWLAGAVEESTWSGEPHIGPVCWSPNINIARDPRWGRNMETASEEPLLNGDFGTQYTLGLQNGEDARYIKTVVTLKHWDAYSLEDADGFTRHNFNAVVSPYALETTYFPAFRKSVTQGKAKGVMCSYNAVNGVPSCANEFLNNDVLRGLWGFDGYITSDTGAVEDIYEQHHYCSDVQCAACSALNATTDVCSGFPYHDALLGCASGTINASLARTFKLRMQLGLFDPIEDQPYWNTPLSAVNTSASQAVNKLATDSSLVLLKNNGPGALPLTPGKRLAVIGPHANATSALVGNYLGQLCLEDRGDSNADCVRTPFQAISELNVGGTTSMALGTQITHNDSTWGTALALAADADAVVLMVGIDTTVEGESNDRTSIALPSVQLAFAAAVAALGKPTTVVLLNGGVLDVTPLLNTSNFGGILEAFYPGFLGAQAIADTLFGSNEHCCGAMPVTTYPASYVNAINMSQMELDVGPGRGYRFYTGQPVVPFGFGLSLTSFNLAFASLPSNTALSTGTTPTTVLTYVVTVTNAGSRPGDAVVQAYYKPRSTPTQPKSKLLQQLFGYQRVHLDAGATTQVTFNVDSSTLRMVDRDTGASVSVPGSFDVVFQTGQPGTAITSSVTVTGGQVQVAAFPF